MAIQEDLQNIGLSKKEAEVYTLLVELGESSVLDIAKRSAIKRPTVYVILRSLQDRGLASKVLKGKRTLFVPRHPRTLMGEAELRLKAVERIMPQLESLLRQKEGKPRVMIYEGKDQLDRAYDDAFVATGESLFISTIGLSKEVFPRSFQKITLKTFSPDYRWRELMDESEEAKKYAQTAQGPYREIRFIPKKLLPFDTDIGIFGNNVVITSAKGEYFTIRIESKEISHAFRVMFELMWQASVPLLVPSEGEGV